MSRRPRETQIELDELIRAATEARALVGLPTPPADPTLAERLVAIIDDPPSRHTLPAPEPRWEHRGGAA